MFIKMKREMQYKLDTGNGWAWCTERAAWYCFREDEEVAGPCELAPWEEEDVWSTHI